MEFFIIVFNGTQLHHTAIFGLPWWLHSLGIVSLLNFRHWEIRGEALSNIGLVLVVHCLINDDVHLIDKDTVSWHTITLLNVNDVTNDKIFQLD